MKALTVLYALMEACKSSIACCSATLAAFSVVALVLVQTALAVARASEKADLTVACALMLSRLNSSALLMTCSSAICSGVLSVLPR